MRALGGLLVDVEELRIRTPGKPLDAVGGERVCPDLPAFADFQILEEFHAPAPGVRRANMSGAVSAMTFSPDALVSSIRTFTKPVSGRLDEARVESTVT